MAIERGRSPLLIKVAAPVAVPEEGNVAKLLGLAARKDGQAVFDHVLAARPLDEGRGNKVVLGQLEVAVVLQRERERRREIRVSL